MSAPAPPPTSRWQQVPFAVVLAGVGFVIVWQGFGLAGFGTDLHPSRVGIALVPLFLCAMLVAQPDLGAVRLIAALAGLGAAGYVWWDVRPSGFKSALALGEAVRTRDWYKQRLAITTAEEAEKSEGLRGVRPLLEQYPSLCKGMSAEYDRWADAVADDIVSRYNTLPRDDFKGAEALVNPAKALASVRPVAGGRLDAARLAWRTDAVRARLNELSAARPGDWEGFNRSAFARRALAEAVPDARDVLLRAETEWVDSSVELLAARALVSQPGGGTPREFLKRTDWEVLALRSLDTTTGRFLKARGRLFRAAHDRATREAFAHFEAGRHDRAFGVAVAHAVDWTGAAELLGEPERKAVLEFRATHEFFAALASKAEPRREVAPPPRSRAGTEPRLEVAPRPRPSGAPEPRFEVAPPPRRPGGAEPRFEIAPPPRPRAGADPQFEVAPPPRSRASTEPRPEEAPRPRPSGAPEPRFQVAPRPRPSAATKPRPEVAPVPRSKVIVEPRRETAPPPRTGVEQLRRPDADPEPQYETAPPPRPKP
ncbi:hypothetical protein R5W24_005609 [Gemmata sp. JC717]|uniref:hypothetical protein n=1 Tax=Gemmata algarum TaxID=2975278 RepID=UPI0021BAE0F9|nr:hypothetical protein [Gemmata algarum]MDY3556443.1 hypothetical protein [Gemmata algarum]